MTESTKQSDGPTDRIDRLERENEQLRERLVALETGATAGTDGQATDDGRVDGPEAHETALTSGGQPTKVVGRLSDTDGIGVLGEATGGGAAYGIQGITQSSGFSACGVRAEAPNGATALRAVSTGGTALRAESAGDSGTGVRATTDGNGNNGVFGNNTATSGYSWGVRGDTSSTADAATGVRGYHNSSSGQGAGVWGTTRSSGDGAAGVRGDLTSSNGDTAGVEGVNDSSTSRSAGVRGRHTNTGSTSATGVEGVTQATGPTAAGVFGRQTNESGGGYGVYGHSAGDDNSNAGVLGRQEGSGDRGYGVRGENFRENGRGFYGIAYGSSSGTGNNQSIGVVCQASSGLGLYSYDPIFVSGDIDGTGAKNFVQTVDTARSSPIEAATADAANDDHREVVYTAVESPTVRTEVTGRASTSEGRARVTLPDHFGWVTDPDEPILVQVTPHGDTNGLAVTERSLDRFVVEERDGSGSTTFDYTVRGTRDGYADKTVVRESADHTASERAKTDAIGASGADGARDLPPPPPPPSQDDDHDE